jgi:hypothetical protein
MCWNSWFHGRFRQDENSILGLARLGQAPNWSIANGRPIILQAQQRKGEGFHLTYIRAQNVILRTLLLAVVLYVEVKSAALFL